LLYQLNTPIVIITKTDYVTFELIPFPVSQLNEHRIWHRDGQPLASQN
jgi:hypothetical protein